MAFLGEPRGPAGREVAEAPREQGRGRRGGRGPRLRGPRLGTKAARLPLLPRGRNADARASGLPCPPPGRLGAPDGGSSGRSLAGLAARRTRSTVSRACGSGGRSGAGAAAGRRVCAGGGSGGPRGIRGVILTVTGLHTARGCRRDQMVRFR